MVELEALNISNENALELSKSGYWSMDLRDDTIYKSSLRTVNMFGEELNDDLIYSTKTHEERISVVDPAIAEETLSALPS